MKKYCIFALALVLAGTMFAGCRRRGNDMDTNPGDTSLPTGDTTPATTQDRQTDPVIDHMPTETQGTSGDHGTDSTSDSGAATDGTQNSGDTQETTGMEGRIRRIPGMR